MKTDLKTGTWVSFRSRGGIALAQVIDGDEKNGKLIEMGRTPEEGAVVHRCVWKERGTSLESRGTYRFKKTPSDGLTPPREIFPCPRS